MAGIPDQQEPAVQADQPVASLPPELHPVPAAFRGAAQGEALAKGGQELEQQTQQISEWNWRMNYYANKEKIATGQLQADSAMKALQFGDPNDPESKGVMQLKGMDAQGSTEAFQSAAMQHIHSIIDTYAKNGMKGNDLADLQARLYNQFYSYKDAVAKNEYQQVHQGTNQSMNAAMSVAAHSAANTTDPNSLGKLFDNIHKQNSDLAGYNEEFPNPDGSLHPIAQERQDKYDTMTMKTAVQSAIRNGGDLEKANALIDSMVSQGKIGEDVADESKGYAERTYNAFQSQQKKDQETSLVTNRLGVLTALGSGKINANTPASDIDSITAQDPALGSAVNTVIDEKNNYEPKHTDTEAKEFQGNVTDMINSSSQKQLSDFLTNPETLKNLQKQTNMNVLVNALMNHAKTLPVLDNDPNSPIPQNTSSMAFNALNDWADRAGLSVDDRTKLMNTYLDGMAKNAPAKQNYDNAIRNHMISAYPSLATKDIDNIPTEIDGNSQGFNKAVNFAQGTKQEKAKKFPDRRLVVTPTEPAENEATETPLEKEAKDFNG